MPKRRKGNKPPQHLTDFYPAAAVRGKQDVAGPSSSGTARSPHSHHDVGKHFTTPPEDSGDFSSPSTPTTQSPAKTRQQREEEVPSHGMQPVSSPCLMQSRQAESLIETFPATNQSISESTMKDMLLSLRKTLFNDFSNMMAPLSATVKTNSDKIHYLETKMAELYSAHNDLDDAYTDQENENQCLQTKLTDLEDRSRRNNIKFRGIPESVPPNELTKFIQRLMKALLPSLSDI